MNSLAYRNEFNERQIYMITLINALNSADFKAFPQKENPKRLTITANGADGKRYFVNRATMGKNEDGSAKWEWVKGKEMQAMNK